MIDIDRAGALILDFDGPVCDVFGDVSVPLAAAMLESRVSVNISTSDPFDTLRAAINNPGVGCIDEIADALEDVERIAMHSAPAAPGGIELVRFWWGRPLAIVSNNARRPIETWLRRHGIRSPVNHVRGRSVRKMKPDPWPLLTAARHIGVSPANCVYVGDALSDGKAAESAGMTFAAVVRYGATRAEFKQQGTAVTIVDSSLDLLPQPQKISTKTLGKALF